MVNDLKLYAGKFKKCINMNKEKENEMNYQRIKITKKKCCVRDVRHYDAEEYFKGQIEELMQKIRIEEQF